MYYFIDSGPKFTGLVWLNAGGIARDHMSFRFWISCVVPETFAIKVGSCVKLAEILHVFWPPNFLGEGPPNFRTCIIKSTLILIMWQISAAIGRRSSEILWLIKKTSQLKHKAFQNYRSGRPNNRMNNDTRNYYILCS